MALPQSEELSGAPLSVVAAELIAAGSALQLAGACREAIPLFEQAITIDPNFANVYALLGLCHYEQGQIDAAVARWQEALADDPFSPDALAGLGTALYRLGRREDGLEHYRQAVAVDPGYGDEAYLRAQRLWGAPALLDVPYALPLCHRAARGNPSPPTRSYLPCSTPGCAKRSRMSAKREAVSASCRLSVA
jgi:tetratricopeptide (TPR) repeat protein